MQRSHIGTLCHKEAMSKVAGIGSKPKSKARAVAVQSAALMVMEEITYLSRQLSFLKRQKQRENNEACSRMFVA